MGYIFAGVDPIHFLLAYAGMIVHILSKMDLLSGAKEFSLKAHVKKNIYSILASLIMIPILLIMATDASIKELLPINKVTAVIAGAQTQSIFNSLLNVYAKKRGLTTTTTTTNDNPTPPDAA